MKIDNNKLKEILPHRPPILMIDEVVDIDPGKKGTGKRTFQADDPAFEGHFPNLAILPGVLAIEAFAQTALVVAMLDPSRPGQEARNGRMAKVQEISFLEAVFPGASVDFQIEIEKRVGPFVFVDCQAKSDGDISTRGKLVLKI